MKHLFLIIALFLCLAPEATASHQKKDSIDPCDKYRGVLFDDFSTPPFNRFKEQLILEGDTFLLSTEPFNDYFEENIEVDSIPELAKIKRILSQQHFKATWKIEKGSLYLTEIKYVADPKKWKSRDAEKLLNLHTLFGDKCDFGKVKGDWITRNLYVQYGDTLGQYFPHWSEKYLSREKEIRIEKGNVINIADYAAYTGEDAPGYYRVLIDNIYDKRVIIRELIELLNDRFQWTEEMKGRKTIRLSIFIDNSFETQAGTGKEYHKFRIQNSLEDYLSTPEPKSERKAQELEREIEELSCFLLDLETDIEEEYEKEGIYLNEFKRILNPLKIEALIKDGKPYRFPIIWLMLIVDADKQLITNGGVSF